MPQEEDARPAGMHTGPESGAPGADYYRRQLEAVANNATLALFIMDERQHCTYMNPAAEELTGFTLEEVQGRPLHDVIHHTRPDGSHYPLEECPIDRAFPQNAREQGEEVFVHRDGHFYPVAFTASPVLADGRTTGTIIEVRGIAAERRAQEELRVERSRLATVFQQAPAFIATVRGPEHVFEMANPRYYQLVGHRDILGKPVREALPEVEGQGFFELLDRVRRTGEPFVGTEMRILLQRSPGAALEERFVNFVFQPLADADGVVSGVLAHGVDVTGLVHARTRAEEQARLLETQAAQLEEAHALMDAFYESLPIPAAVIGRDLRFRRINAALARIYGVPAEEVVGRSIREVVPHYAATVEPYYRQLFATGEPIRDVTVTIPSGTGREAHYLMNYFPVRVRGEVIGAGFVALDVTERHAAAEAQREQATTVETLHRIGRTIASELELESIVQEVTDAATALTGARFGAFFYNAVSDEGERYTLHTVSGVSREAFAGFPMPRNTPVFAPTFRGEAVVRSDDITRDPRYGSMEPYHGMPEGRLPVRSYLAVPVVSRTREVLGGLFFGHEEPGVFGERHERLAVGIASWAALAMDNGRLYRAEHRARAEAERANRAKSDFLATMSHELRTPLNAMIGYTDLLLAGVPEPVPEGAQRKVERIGVSSRHLLELIEEILTFSRLEAGEERVEAERLGLRTLLEEVQALTEPLALAKGIRFECHVPDPPGSIRSDARKVRQILVNLLGNAIKFTDRGHVALSLEATGEEVVFRVSDTGPGIAPEHLEKVFEPFWQVEGGATRTAGGTGLGLSVTRRLARLLGGEVTAESEPGRGSTFTVRLPVHAPPGERP